MTQNANEAKKSRSFEEQSVFVTSISFSMCFDIVKSLVFRGYEVHEVLEVCEINNGLRGQHGSMFMS